MLNKADYWLDLCDEDMITAKLLLKGKRLLHMAFFCHQITEKALKAVVSDVTDEIPPKIHDLLKLANISGTYGDLSEKQLSFIEEINPFNIEARYPDYKTKIETTLTNEKCVRLLKETEDFLCWIKKKLEK